MSAECTSVKRITADKQLDTDGNAKGFLLRSGTEQVALEPGKAWGQIDVYKWVTRGLIEEPSGFHVLPNGAVQIHGDQIDPGDPNGVIQLEERINQHLGAAPIKRSLAPDVFHAPVQPQFGPRKVRFKVRLDKLGHLMVMSMRTEEDRLEIGIRGLESLVRDGLMLKPRSIHVDPLLSYVEIDDVRFDSTPAGAQDLENRLNTAYAPVLKSDGHAPIEIRANPASPSGFDISFVTTRAGRLLEIKGHLSQAQLDLLQDQARCQLLHPEIVLKISPPHLIIRRRRRDSSEEKIPEFPDVHYMHVTAAELQRILNHPAIRRGAIAAEHERSFAEEHKITEILGFDLVRNSETKVFLGLHILTRTGNQTKAFTHHNIAELQHAGVFRSNLDVALDLENRKLSILNTETQQEESVVLDHSSPDSDLGKAAQMLTSALKPPALSAVAHVPPPRSEQIPASVPLEQREGPAERPTPLLEVAPEIQPTAVSQPPSPPGKQSGDPLPSLSEPVPELQPDNPAIRALFQEQDPLRINVEIFRRSSSCLGLPVQDILLSLEMIFHNRRFEILSFTHPEVSSVLEIRTDSFAGFYLSHINEQKVLLDFAWYGKRIEWGPEKCLLQGSVAADSEEFRSSALLGMALPEQHRFVFVVTPAFKQWVKSRERLYEPAGVTFVTVDDLAAAPEKYPLVWPVPPGPVS